MRTEFGNPLTQLKKQHRGMIRMLLDVGILTAIYIVIRRFENNKEKKQQKNKNRVAHSVEKPQSSAKVVIEKDMSIPADKNLVENCPENAASEMLKKKHDRYFLIGNALNLGVATIRQFIYPPIAPLSIVLFSYTLFPEFKQAENLMRERRIGHEILSVTFSVLGMMMNQYALVALNNLFYYASNKIIEKTQDRSKKMLINIFEQLPSKAWVLKDNVEIEVAIEELQINDIVIVNTGEVIPIDGIITQGIALIDQHALTGESQPAEKVAGEQVFASTIVITGKISIKVEKAGNDTIFSKVLQILNHSINSKTHLQSQGEKWADQAALPFLGLSALTLGLLGSYSTLVVLSSTFGYRIRILAPLGTLNHLNLAYQKGILVKEGRALENLTQVDTFLFDKTGTLTLEQPEVGRIISCDDYDENEILMYAAAAERKVAHPLAKAILKKAEESKLSLPDIEDSKYQMGYGITVSFNNNVIRVGSSRFMSMEGIVLPEPIKKAMAHSHLQGHSIIMVAVNQNIVGAIELQTVVRPEVKQLIAGLRQRGIKHLAIVSGDQKQPTQQLAKQLGMDSYYSEVLPQDKAKIVEQLQKEGKSVCFVGDGINDVIAMKKADVSISLSGASSIATDIAQVIFMDGTLSHLTWLFDISTNLETNLRNSLIITMIPAAMGVSGAFLINMKILSAILLKNGFFLFGIGNAMLPLNKLDKSPESKL
jgi:Cu2+-exporting ATPase